MLFPLALFCRLFHQALLPQVFFGKLFSSAQLNLPKLGYVEEQQKQGGWGVHCGGGTTVIDTLTPRW